MQCIKQSNFEKIFSTAKTNSRQNTGQLVSQECSKTIPKRSYNKLKHQNTEIN